jgi:two-component system nitrogen regulation sensor histidine kinase NtrY
MHARLVLPFGIAVLLPAGLAFGLAFGTGSLPLTAAVTLLVGVPIGFAVLFMLARAVAEQGRQFQELLQAVVEAAPMAIVFYGESGLIHYTNASARQMFFEGGNPTGQNFLTLLRSAPEALRQAVLTDSDELFTVEGGGEPETYHLSKVDIVFCNEPHTLLMVKHLTREMSRQEVQVWKKVIRVISHELNNSLAPISSLAHSARHLLAGQEQEVRLRRVFDTIEERAAHLQAFLDGYARFAKLPPPRPQAVEWPGFVDGIRELYPHVGLGPVPRTAGWFDPAQMQQVLINLLKNAAEAGGPPEEIHLEIHEADGGVRFEVHDRGRGLSSELFQTALLPFTTTKDKGSGLGLPLCREIVEAHRGKLRIQNREGGGAIVTCWVPGRSAAQTISNQVKLTMTRA